MKIKNIFWVVHIFMEGNSDKREKNKYFSQYMRFWYMSAGHIARIHEPVPAHSLARAFSAYKHKLWN